LGRRRCWHKVPLLNQWSVLPLHRSAVLLELALAQWVGWPMLLELALV
jgi:hypothetical protein